VRNLSGREPARPRDADLVLGPMSEATAAALEHASRLAAQGRSADALAMCRRLNANAPGHAEILSLLGLLLARTGDLQKGLATLAQALLIAPHDPLVLYNLAQVYLWAGAPMHALHSLRSYRNEVQHVVASPDLPDARSLLESLTTFMQGEPGLTGLAADTQDKALMGAERGRLRLLFSDDPAKALPELRDAIRSAPRYPQPRNNLSLAYFYNGQPDAAMATLEATLRDVDPDNVYALTTLAWMRWATGGDLASAVPLLARAAAQLTPAARILDRTHVAEVAGVLGDHALARAVLADAGPAAPASTEPLEGTRPAAARVRLLATALANLGQADAAAELLREAPTLAIDPLARRLLAAVDRGEPLPAAAGGGYPYIGWDDLLSPYVLRRTLGAVGHHRIALRPAAPPAPQQVAARITALYPRLALACAILLWMGDPQLESLGVTLLALAGTPEAAALLDAHLRGTLGSYSGRQEAGYALLDAGRLRNETVVPFWTGTAWGEIRLFRLTPRNRDLPALCGTLGTLLARLAPPSDSALLG